MKSSLFFLFVFGLGVQSIPEGGFHNPNQPEALCLTEENVDMTVIAKNANIVSDVNSEDVGRYYACVYKKREVIIPNNKVSAENIVRYLKDIHYTARPSETDEKQMRDASDECAKIEDKNEGALAIKVKNCIFEAIGKMPFLYGRSL